MRTFYYQTSSDSDIILSFTINDNLRLIYFYESLCLISDLIVDIILVMWVSTKGHKKVVIFITMLSKALWYLFTLKLILVLIVIDGLITNIRVIISTQNWKLLPFGFAYESLVENSWYLHLIVRSEDCFRILLSTVSII